MELERDLNFIAKKWDSFELPKEKKYLLKYFETGLQEMFLKYLLIFGDHENFVDHTGNACQLRWKKFLTDRLHILELAHKEAKANMDMSLLAQIEMGKYDLPISIKKGK